MGLADLDECDLHVTVKDHFSSLPYVDAATGLTTLDMPIESAEIVDQVYEPRKHDLGTARVTFPSLMRQPELRPLMQRIVDGARVEIYSFQPDCGDPVFAGYVPPEGITEQDGKVSLAVHDPMVRGQWDDVRRSEEFNAPVSELYDRGLSHWATVINEDFSAGVPGRFTLLPPASAGFSGGSGDSGIDQTGIHIRNTSGDSFQFAGQGIVAGYSAVPFQMSPGGTYLLEFDAAVRTDGHIPPFTSRGVDANGFTSWTGGVAEWSYQVVLADALNLASIQSLLGVDLQYGVRVLPAPLDTAPVWTVGSLIAAVLRNPSSAQPTALVEATSGAVDQATMLDESSGVHYAMAIRFSHDRKLSFTFYRQNIQITSFADWPAPPGFLAQPMYLVVALASSYLGAKVTVNNVRLQALQPYVARAGRFVPQTQDAIYYVANNETCLDFFNLFVEKDGAEYRVLPKPAPAPDIIELDQQGTLGQNASALLGYGPTSAAGTQSPRTSPTPALTETGQFASTPPFRFEEGHNLAAAPKRASKATPHVNEVLRMGAGQLDAQAFAVAYSAAETGNPGAGIAPRFPRFVTVVNDDRVGLQDVNRDMAQLDLQRGLDSTPSLELQVNEQLEYAFRYRAGDWAWVKTQSLVTNVEQLMRIAKVQHKSGSPTRTITVGRLAQDPDSLRLLHKAMVQSWLYEQSGSSALIIPYAGVPTSAPTTPAQTIALDQFTTGSQIVYAGLHWFTKEAPVSDVTAVINGAQVNTAASGTDSGLIKCTGLFPQPGVYNLSFYTAGHTLTAAMLVIRIKL